MENPWVNLAIQTSLNQYDCYVNNTVLKENVQEKEGKKEKEEKILKFLETFEKNPRKRIIKKEDWIDDIQLYTLFCKDPIDRICALPYEPMFHQVINFLQKLRQHKEYHSKKKKIIIQKMQHYFVTLFQNEKKKDPIFTMITLFLDKNKQSILNGEDLYRFLCYGISEVVQMNDDNNNEIQKKILNQILDYFKGCSLNILFNRILKAMDHCKELLDIKKKFYKNTVKNALEILKCFGESFCKKFQQMLVCYETSEMKNTEMTLMKQKVLELQKTVKKISESFLIKKNQLKNLIQEKIETLRLLDRERKKLNEEYEKKHAQLGRAFTKRHRGLNLMIKKERSDIEIKVQDGIAKRVQQSIDQEKEKWEKKYIH